VSKDVDLEEFKALVKNLVPATLEQAEWVAGRHRVACARFGACAAMVMLKIYGGHKDG